MLPYTPLQYLLFHEAADRPGVAWLDEPPPLVLVMTSANPGGEPLVTEEDEAFRRLRNIADAFVTHDRAIVVRCDDSVVRSERGTPAFIRRARGYTPVPIKLAAAGPSVLATGAFLKNAICVTRGDEAFLSQHIGDLDNAPTAHALGQVAAHLLAVLDVTPDVVAHDLHPDFYSTRFAAEFARERDIPVVAVQHHHAHVAAVAAEHGVVARARPRAGRCGHRPRRRSVGRRATSCRTQRNATHRSFARTAIARWRPRRTGAVANGCRCAAPAGSR